MSSRRGSWPELREAFSPPIACPGALPRRRLCCTRAHVDFISGQRVLFPLPPSFLPPSFSLTLRPALRPPPCPHNLSVWKLHTTDLRLETSRRRSCPFRPTQPAGRRPTRASSARAGCRPRRPAGRASFATTAWTSWARCPIYRRADERSSSASLSIVLSILAVGELRLRGVRRVLLERAGASAGSSCRRGIETLES